MWTVAVLLLLEVRLQIQTVMMTSTNRTVVMTTAPTTTDIRITSGSVGQESMTLHNPYT